MKPILVLAPSGAGAAPALEGRQVDLHRIVPTEETEVNAESYSTVIVINDGGADTIRRLLMALRMQQDRQHLSIGVLSYLDGAACREIMSRAQPDSGPGLHPTIEALRSDLKFEPKLKIGLDEEVISFEYQAL